MCVQVLRTTFEPDAHLVEDDADIGAEALGHLRCQIHGDLGQELDVRFGSLAVFIDPRDATAKETM